jgi:predicted dehydrogenase
METKTTRRHFIRNTSLAGFALAGLGPWRTRAAPSEQMTVAVIGIRSRGTALGAQFASLKTCHVKAVVDVDKRYWEKAVRTVEGVQGRAPTAAQDYRRVLEDPTLDAVVIATPDHWHAPMAIEAIKAGKHVYVEKPCSHNPHEGELLVQAAKRYDRRVQMGAQRRSHALARRMIAELHGGVIGRVYFAKTWYSNARPPIGYGHPCAPPTELDFDLWQGPAPRTAYRSNIHPYNWHWFWRWGTGESLNNGTHAIDLARWGLQVDVPTQVASLGGRFHYPGQDDWECPDTQTITAQFGEGKMIVWEGLSCNKITTEQTSHGVRFHGTDGALVFQDNGYTVYDKSGREIKTVGSQDVNAQSTNPVDPGVKDNHAENFIGAVLGRNNLNAPVDEGQKSVLIAQLGNIALRSRSTVICDPGTGRILDNPAAQKLWQRTYEPGWEPSV